MRHRASIVGVLLAAALVTLACGHEAAEAPPAPASPPPVAPYPISERGGTPPTGPGDRYNSCERIWCLVDEENFFITHFLSGHHGWILHDDDHGDVFVPSRRDISPGFPNAKLTVLRLCGSHVHPWMLGGSGAVRHTGFNRTLGYSRAHFEQLGTRLDPCCINGLGWAFLHSGAGRQFRFHDTALYRSHPEMGWSRPFAVVPRTVAGAP